MLKLRVASIAILLPIVLSAIVLLPTIYIAIAAGIVLFLAALEWLNMVYIKKMREQIVLAVFLLVLGWSLLKTGMHADFVYWYGLLFWLIALIGICYYPSSATYWQLPLVQPLIAMALFIPAWLAIVALHALGNGYVWLLLVLALVWNADISAYIAGRLWGRDKLCPKLSPGKTWVGAYAAVLSNLFLISIFYYYYQPSFKFSYAIWLALLTTVFAILGDLVESMFKRIYGFKDSGSLIPGHGGVLDRMDSTLAAMPVFIIALQNIKGL